MKTFRKLDRETFQQLLANAFAVQESEIDTESLCAFVEIQRLLAKGEISVAGAMNLVVESARCVDNADGIAIGILRGSSLVYKAGSGSASADVDREVKASLTASASAMGSREILRVENAEQDNRIQAAVCRQLGAKALLILPISSQGALTGVLEVRYNRSHTFKDREVRTYRLMAALVDEALVHAAHAERIQRVKMEREIQRSVIPRGEQKSREEYRSEPGFLGLENAQEPPQWERVSSYGSIPAPSHTVFQRSAAAWVRLKNAQAFKRPALWAATTLELAKTQTWRNKSRGMAWVATAAACVLVFFLGYKDLRASHHKSVRPMESVVDQQPDRQPLLSRDSKSTPIESHGSLLGGIRSAAPVRWASTGKSEVEIVRGDVTMRYFNYKPVNQRRPISKSRVQHIGDDVTVRYFSTDPATESVSR